MTSTTTRRTIVSEEEDLRHNLLVAADSIHPGGLVIAVRSVADAEADADEALATLKGQIGALEPAIGWQAMDAILSSLNVVTLRLREEAVARLIAAAVQTQDFAQGVFVAPEAIAHRHIDPIDP